MTNNATRPRDLTALLVLRVWIEHGSSLPLRTYIRKTRDVSKGLDRGMTATDVEAAVATVRVWLEGIVVDGGSVDVKPDPAGDDGNGTSHHAA